MDYMPDTLAKTLREYRKNKKPFPALLTKIYAYQLLRSLAYLDSLEIAHRDIKPQNILVDNTSNLLKICDFGSAKKLIKGTKTEILYIKKFIDK